MNKQKNIDTETDKKIGIYSLGFSIIIAVLYAAIINLMELYDIYGVLLLAITIILILSSTKIMEKTLA
ncbi:hypothetical protein [Methanonatronarchaeum sp. AMET6-2]|uniref:hypothetical protein n=1 Tax=Methanonatronarchaeum sp. AMET6-2 TaxID=2933293 RepID=UPI00122947D7|nr:hypothetical protein [Methanonatronarchaeum sp. AMET6-2]RZN63140.1 MAG: hypothetical protein EF811_01060 [Methanonatronarchaeia archaeon]UOY09434.1 hypothetical protein MU439_04040 [Methanonatronarchaeum sp. AMET6-2]